MKPLALKLLRDLFGERVQVEAPLARLTAARVGGQAEVLLEVRSADELAEAAGLLWQMGLPFTILGGGANVLISDSGVRGVVVLNKARAVRFIEGANSPEGDPPSVWVESGANLGSLARQAAAKGLGGLEWAAGIPGTVGGAVFGNAGAHGGDTAGNLVQAEVVQPNWMATPPSWRRERWPVERFEFAYRSSSLKNVSERKDVRQPAAVVLSAVLRLQRSARETVQAKMDEFVAHRRRTQPPGASMGSMFKNPPGGFSGQLIEAAGLKGTRVGGAEISALHANFFVNTGSATAAEVYTLIQQARQTVFERFGIKLELEIELLGDFQ